MTSLVSLPSFGSSAIERIQEPSPAKLRHRWAVRLARSDALLLALAAALQIAFARRLTSLTGAFQDEGLYLYMGHRILGQWAGGPAVFEAPGSYFSGSPYFYPLLAALVDDVGGLQAVRDMSLVMVIITTIAVHQMTRELFGRFAAALAVPMFITNASVIHLSQWATFDSMTMMFGSLAVWLAVYSARRDGLLLAPLVAVLLVASTYAKYAGAMFVPLAAGLAIAAGWRLHGVRVLKRAIFMGASASVMFLFIVLLFNRDLLYGIDQTTTERDIINQSSTLDLLIDTGRWAGPWLLPALLGGVLLARRRPFLAMVLVFGSVLAPLEQFRIGEGTSLNKHLAFGMIFAAPLVGQSIARLRRQWLATAIAVLAAATLAVYGVRTAQRFHTGYSEDAPLISVLQQAVVANDGKPILGEQPSAQRYELRDLVGPKQWADTWKFSYDGKQGADAYRAAVRDHYFGVIYLDLSTPNSRVVFDALNEDPIPNRYYHLVAIVPGELHGKKVGSWLVWTPQTHRYTEIPGANGKR